MSEDIVRDIQKIEDEKFLDCCEAAVLRTRRGGLNAYEQGIEWRSCEEALEARKALGLDATQADWWRACKRGDWLLWQLNRLSRLEHASVHPVLRRALKGTVARAVRRGQQDWPG